MGVIGLTSLLFSTLRHISKFKRDLSTFLLPSKVKFNQQIFTVEII
jgi:hypothetical protein